ncbi:MAG: DUF5320 family protein [Thermodesulfobacteriota bacterium]
MPGFDETGPKGAVPRAGRGRGPGGAGLRRGATRGRHQGFRSRDWGQPPAVLLWGGPPRWGNGSWWFGHADAARGSSYGSRQEEAAALKAEAARLQEELEAIYNRLVKLGESPN